MPYLTNRESTMVEEYEGFDPPEDLAEQPQAEASPAAPVAEAPAVVAEPAGEPAKAVEGADDTLSAEELAFIAELSTSLATGGTPEPAKAAEGTSTAPHPIIARIARIMGEPVDSDAVMDKVEEFMRVGASVHNGPAVLRHIHDTILADEDLAANPANAIQRLQKLNDYLPEESVFMRKNAEGNFVAQDEYVLKLQIEQQIKEATGKAPTPQELHAFYLNKYGERLDEPDENGNEWRMRDRTVFLMDALAARKSLDQLYQADRATEMGKNAELATAMRVKGVDRRAENSKQITTLREKVAERKNTFDGVEFTDGSLTRDAKRLFDRAKESDIKQAIFELHLNEDGSVNDESVLAAMLRSKTGSTEATRKHYASTKESTMWQKAATQAFMALRTGKAGSFGNGFSPSGAQGKEDAARKGNPAEFEAAGPEDFDYRKLPRRQ